MLSPAPPRSPRRLIQLDVLRGVAILLVLGHHALLDPGRAGILEPVARAWRDIGWSGVDLFFVLSGYLIGGLLLTELRRYGSLDVKRFLIRRAFKIWPPYLLFLGYLAIWAALKSPTPEVFEAIAYNVLHLQNYLGTPRPHTWSLAVEEHFYLLLPMILLLLTRASRSRGPTSRSMVLTVVAVGLGCLALRLMGLDRSGVSLDARMFPTHLRLDSLLFGVILAYLVGDRPDIIRALTGHRPGLLLLGGALVLPFAFRELDDPLVWTIGFSILYLGYGSLLLAFVLTPAIPGSGFGSFPARILARIGTYSYGIYIWHQEAKYFLIPRLASGEGAGATFWLAGTLSYLGLAFALGVLSTRVVEAPFLRIRDRLVPSRTGSPNLDRTGGAGEGPWGPVWLRG